MLDQAFDKPANLVERIPGAPGLGVCLRLNSTTSTAYQTTWIEAAPATGEAERRKESTTLAYRADVGRVVGFHALRRTFISGLAAVGIQPKKAQELARHSTITLTMDHYTHTRRGELAGLQLIDDIEELPSLSEPISE